MRGIAKKVRGNSKKVRGIGKIVRGITGKVSGIAKKVGIKSLNPPRKGKIFRRKGLHLPYEWLKTPFER